MCHETCSETRRKTDVMAGIVKFPADLFERKMKTISGMEKTGRVGWVQLLRCPVWSSGLVYALFSELRENHFVPAVFLLVITARWCQNLIGRESLNNTVVSARVESFE